MVYERDSPFIFLTSSILNPKSAGFKIFFFVKVFGPLNGVLPSFSEFANGVF